MLSLLQQLLQLVNSSSNNSSSNVAGRGLAAPISFTAHCLLQLLLQLPQLSNFSLGCVRTCPALSVRSAWCPALFVILCYSSHVLRDSGGITTTSEANSRWLLKALRGSMPGAENLSGAAKHKCLLLCMTHTRTAGSLTWFWLKQQQACLPALLLLLLCFPSPPI